jgi:hypothetical protein
MAKVDDDYAPPVPPKPKPSRRGLAATVLVSCCALLVVVRSPWENFPPFASSLVKYLSNPGEIKCNSSIQADSDGFDWKKVTSILFYLPMSDREQIYPSEKLHWIDCYDGFKCARLQVPLDYSKPHEEKAAIALLKVPSKYEMDDPRWRGPILYNPVGPRSTRRDWQCLTGDPLGRTGWIWRSESSDEWEGLCEDYWGRV